MLISDLIMVLQDELEGEGDIPVRVSVKTDRGVRDVDIVATTARLVNSLNKYILLIKG